MIVNILNKPANNKKPLNCLCTPKENSFVWWWELIEIAVIIKIIEGIGFSIELVEFENKNFLIRLFSKIIPNKPAHHLMKERKGKKNFYFCKNLTWWN